MTFDHNKTAPKKRKKQLAAKEMGDERRSTLSIRCVHFDKHDAVFIFHGIVLWVTV